MREAVAPGQMGETTERGEGSSTERLFAVRRELNGEDTKTAQSWKIRFFSHAGLIARPISIVAIMTVLPEMRM
jgi:hypothetical protein